MDKQKAKELVSRDMVDPKSAQFRNLAARDGYACGQVNGKNRFGGYTGFRGFLVRLDDGTVVLEPDQPSQIGLNSLQRNAQQFMWIEDLKTFEGATARFCGVSVGTHIAQLK